MTRDYSNRDRAHKTNGVLDESATGAACAMKGGGSNTGKLFCIFHCGRNMYRVLIGKPEEKQLLGETLQREIKELSKWWL